MQADAPVREVFNITTGSDDVLPEVQRVTVSYEDVDEVQTIATSQVRCTLPGSGRRGFREEEFGYDTNGLP